MDQAQRQQLSQKVKQQLRQVVICKACRRVFGYEPEQLTSKPLDDYVIEVGLSCPGCGQWHRAYWMNADLIAMRRAMGQSYSRKRGRAFDHAFRKFQGRMRKKSYAVRWG